jgi:hypothetical protein
VGPRPPTGAGSRLAATRALKPRVSRGWALGARSPRPGSPRPRETISGSLARKQRLYRIGELAAVRLAALEIGASPLGTEQPLPGAQSLRQTPQTAANPTAATRTRDWPICRAFLQDAATCKRRVNPPRRSSQPHRTPPPQQPGAARTMCRRVPGIWGREATLRLVDRHAGSTTAMRQAEKTVVRT